MEYYAWAVYEGFANILRDVYLTIDDVLRDYPNMEQGKQRKNMYFDDDKNCYAVRYKLKHYGD